MTSESRKRSKNPLQSTMSILDWVPDLDEIHKTITGSVPRAKGDVIKYGDVNDSKNS